MLFKPYHVAMITSGTKVVTRRNWKRCMAKVGGIYAVQTRMYQPKKDCEMIRVTQLYKQRLGDMTEEDARKEGGYTLAQFKKTFADINGFWDDDLVVHVIEFEHIKWSGQ